MTTTHFRDRHDQPVGSDEVSSRDDLSSAVIDGTFGQRWIVDIGHESLDCRICEEPECDHVRSVRQALADHDLLNGGSASWRDQAAILVAHGVPERRAQIVALAATGLGPTAIAEELDVSSPGSIVNQLEAYRQQLAESRWLAEHGPEV